MNGWLRLATLLAVYPMTTGFVLLREQEARLPVDPASPTATFVWDGKTPTIQEKEKYGDGTHANDDDATMMETVLKDAMGLWNNVPGSYVRLDVVTGTDADPATDDHEDHKNSILVLKDSNLSSAALAAPQIDSDTPSVIGDCDIHVNTTPVSAEELGFILAHELGHCLGLGHSHDNYGAIMGYSRAKRSMTLGTDDRTGVIYLYPDPNVTDGKVKELAACGTLGATGPHARATGALLLLLLLAPAAVALWRANERVN